MYRNSTSGKLIRDGVKSTVRPVVVDPTARFDICDLGSPIISLNLSGTPVVILNNAEVAEQLLDKRSSLYADRHVFPKHHSTESLIEISDFPA